MDEVKREQIAGRESAHKITEVLQHIDHTYGKESLAEARLLYHDRSHTEGVMIRARTILGIIDESLRKSGDHGVSQSTFRMTDLAAAFHDIVQNGHIEKNANGLSTRVRKLGDAEAYSAHAFERFMRETNFKYKASIFTEDEIREGREAIQGTAFTINNGTVHQRAFEKEKPSLVAIAVALADLGVVGEDPPAALKDQWRLFLEQNITIAQDILSGKKIPEDQAVLYKKEVLGWLGTQLPFIKGRKENFERELSYVPTAAQESTRKYFGKFDEAIELMKHTIASCNALSFDEIVRFQMGATLAELKAT